MLLTKHVAPHEVIVVVDGPDPATCQALSSLGDPRVRVIALETSVGGAEARNVGARAASGDWIALLDDDDEWLPTKLEKQLQAAARQPGANVVVSRHLLRAEDAEDVVRPRRMPRAGESITDFMFDYLCYFQTSTFLSKRSLFLEVPFTKGQAVLPGYRLVLACKSPSRHAPGHRRRSAHGLPRTSRRVTVTSKIPWKARLEWGKANRHQMGRKAYSRFVVGSCASRAVDEGAGLSGFVLLLRECILGGRAGLMQPILLSGIYLLSSERRRVWRDRLLLRRATPNPILAAPEGT